MNNDRRKLLNIGVLMLCLAHSTWARAADEESRHVITVVGAPGNETYEALFDQWAKRWENAAKSANAGFTRIGSQPSGEEDDHTRIQNCLTQLRNPHLDELWLVLIGHGTFDGESAKFNLMGKDVSAAELNQWLGGMAERTIIINCASASGPFINQLTGPQRIVVTAANSGYEYNFARFGQYLSEAISQDDIDLDKDRQTSLLEAFIVAASKTSEFYASEARLATEHALLEDNGDGRGTPGDWFRGVRAVKTTKDGAATDGLRANQVFLVYRDEGFKLTSQAREERDRLEMELEDLRAEKANLSTQQYESRLEALLVELAKLYRDARSATDND